MHPTVRTLPFFANLSIVTKILGQLLIFSGTFTAQNRSWCKTEKEAYAIWKSVQHFNYYLQGAKCTLCCSHKPLEPFLSRGIKIAKLDREAMLLQEYNITFVHIKGKDNIFADAISRLCTLDIYERTVETQHSPTTKTPRTQTGRHDWPHPEYRFNTIATIPQHELCYSSDTPKTR